MIHTIQQLSGQTLSLEAIKDLAAMAAAAEKFVSDENAAMATLEHRRDGSVMLPSIDNLHARCKEFIQKAEHSIQSLFAIIKLAYPDPFQNWFEGFSDRVHQLYGTNDSFAQFMVNILPNLLFIRNARHCVEHSKPSQKMITCDFSINTKGGVERPTVEFVHAQTPQPPVAVSYFMSELIHGVLFLFEDTVAYICEKNVQRVGGLKTELIRLADEKHRTNKHVSYC